MEETGKVTGMPISMTRAQYEALVAAATKGDSETAEPLAAQIDAANGIRRYILWIRWQNVGGVVPTLIELGRGWPQDQSYKLVLERAIERLDVDEVLRNSATNPVSVMVTPDPDGEVGWTFLGDYEF